MEMHGPRHDFHRITNLSSWAIKFTKPVKISSTPDLRGNTRPLHVVNINIWVEERFCRFILPASLMEVEKFCQKRLAFFLIVFIRIGTRHGIPVAFETAVKPSWEGGRGEILGERSGWVREREPVTGSTRKNCSPTESPRASRHLQVGRLLWAGQARAPLCASTHA